MGLDRDPARVAQHHEEEGHSRQEMCGVDSFAERGADRSRLEVGQVGRRHERDGEGDKEDRRLHERSEGHRPAASQLGVGTASLERRQPDRKAREREDETSAQDVAHVPERQRVLGEHRDEERDGQIAREGNNGPGEEDPARVVRHERLFGEELGDVVIGLQYPRSTAALQPCLEMGHDPAHKGREQQDREVLKHLYLCRVQLRHCHTTSSTRRLTSAEAISRKGQFGLHGRAQPVMGGTHRSLIRPGECSSVRRARRARLRRPRSRRDGCTWRHARRERGRLSLSDHSPSPRRGLR